MGAENSADWNGVLERGCDEAKISEESRLFAVGSRRSVNEGIDKESHRKGYSLKRGSGRSVHRRTVKIEISGQCQTPP